MDGGGGHNKGLYPGTVTLALTLISYASGQPLLFKKDPQYLLHAGH